MTKQEPTTADPSALDAILPAIAKATGAIKRVGKDGKNTHDGYNFASIDDFLALVNPICAEAGIIIHMDEAGTEEFSRKGKYGENPWLRFIFDITVYHISGQSLPTVKRSVEVLRNGAQAFGSAQSYALKQFLRALFLIPTGDKDDADFRATEDGPIERPEPRKPATVAAIDAEVASVEKAAKAIGFANDFAGKVAKSEGAMDAMQLVFDHAAALARLEAYPDAMATVEAALDAHNVTMTIHDGKAVPTEEAGE